MAPKADKAKKAAEKAKIAQKQKVVDDKTFGLKNKNKSKQVQKYVTSLQNSVQPKKPGGAGQQSKKERKAMEEQWKQEIDSLFKPAVKAKDQAGPSNEQGAENSSDNKEREPTLDELIAEVAAGNRDITEVIEAERKKVAAKTRITEQVFRDWRRQKQAELRKAQEKDEALRRKKGILNGREIFMLKGFSAQDDESAQQDYTREVDDEEEIKRMEAEARRRVEAAKREADGGPSCSANDCTGTSSSAAAAPAPGPASVEPEGVLGKLSEADAAAVFEDDELGDEELDDEDDEEDLDMLQQQLESKAAL